MTTVNGKQVEALKAYLERERERTRDQKEKLKTERDRVKVLRGALDAANKKRRELAAEMLAQRAELDAWRTQGTEWRELAEGKGGELRAEVTALRTELAEAKLEASHKDRYREENTRLEGERRGIATRIHGIGVELNGLHDVVLAAQEDADLMSVARRLNELARCCYTAVPALAPASDKNTDCELGKVRPVEASEVAPPYVEGAPFAVKRHCGHVENFIPSPLLDAVQNDAAAIRFEHSDCGRCAP